MAHVGEELAFGAAGRFSRVLRTEKRFLRSLAFGDVLIQKQSARGLTFRAEGHGERFDIHEASIAALAPRDEMGCLPFPKPVGVGLDLRAKVRRSQHVDQRMPDDVLLAVTKEVFERGVAHLHRMVGADRDDPNGRVFDEGVEKGFPLFEVPFRLLSFGDFFS